MKALLILAFSLAGSFARADYFLTDDYIIPSGEVTLMTNPSSLEPAESGGTDPADRMWTCYVKDSRNVDYVGQAYGSQERAKRAALRQCHYYSQRPPTCRVLRCR